MDIYNVRSLCTYLGPIHRKKYLFKLKTELQKYNIGV